MLTYEQVQSDLADLAGREGWSEYDALATAAILGLPHYGEDDPFGHTVLGTINGTVRHVSGSGMSRDIILTCAIYDVDGPHTINVAPTWSLNGKNKLRRAPQGGPVYRVSGVGMDMVYWLAETLFQRACRLLGYEYGAWPYQDHVRTDGRPHPAHRSGR